MQEVIDAMFERKVCYRLQIILYYVTLFSVGNKNTRRRRLVPSSTRRVGGA